MSDSKAEPTTEEVKALFDDPAFGSWLRQRERRPGDKFFPLYEATLRAQLLNNSPPFEWLDEDASRNWVLREFAEWWFSREGRIEEWRAKVTEGTRWLRESLVADEDEAAPQLLPDSEMAFEGFRAWQASKRHT